MTNQNRYAILYLEKIQEGGELMNKNKLLAVIAEHGDNQSKLADCLGISRVTLSKKINEKRNAVFTQPEISAIKKRYQLSDSEVSAIFFA